MREVAPPFPAGRTALPGRTLGAVVAPCRRGRPAPVEGGPMTRTHTGVDTDAVAALVQRARREIDEGLLPACQVALAKDGELVAFEAFGDATASTRFVVFSCTKAFVAGAMWILIGEGKVDVRPRGRPHPRVRGEREGPDHRRAGDAAHLRLPPGTARPASVGDPRDQGGGDGEVAPQLGAGHRLRVPPDLGPLGAGRDHRPGDRRRLPGLRRAARHHAGRPTPCARHHRPVGHRSARAAGRAGHRRRARGGPRRAGAGRGRGDRRRPARLQPARGARRRGPRRRRGDDGRRPRPVLPAPPARRRRDVGSGGQGRRDDQRPQLAARPPHRGAGQPHARAPAGRDRRHVVAARLRQDRVGRGGRPCRGGGPDRLGRPRLGPVPRLRHERHRRQRGAPGPARHRHLSLAGTCATP